MERPKALLQILCGEGEAFVPGLRRPVSPITFLTQDVGFFLSFPALDFTLLTLPISDLLEGEKEDETRPERDGLSRFMIASKR